MRVLYCTVFGIGNSVMAVPAVKAIAAAGHVVDVLVGDTDDDVGAAVVMERLRRHFDGVVRDVHVGCVPRDPFYDAVVLSIPYDGRWGTVDRFQRVVCLDGRSRPDPSTVGLVSWRKHEVEYRMENAVALGFVGETPSCQFMYSHAYLRERTVYLGLGYKRDAAGFWRVKHWGNDNYARFVAMVLDEHPMNRVVTTGDVNDRVGSYLVIRDKVCRRWTHLRDDVDRRFSFVDGTLGDAFDVVGECPVYVGNDTGMMHVAASFGRPTLGLFFLENSTTKSRPWGPTGHVIDGFGRVVTPEEVFERFVEVRPWR